MARTLRFAGTLDDAARARVGEALRARGTSVTWGAHDVFGRTYASAEMDAAFHGVPADFDGSIAFEGPVIAVAVYPRPAEALSSLREAFAGPGRPDGILSCDVVGDALLVEWDPLKTKARLVFAVVDAELRRFSGSRVTRVLTPLSVESAARVAADGLEAPDLTPERVLDVWIESIRERS